jgi:hypothetical protein
MNSRTDALMVVLLLSALRMRSMGTLLCAWLVLMAVTSPTMAVERGKPHIKVFEHFTCSGKVGSYFAGIADRSIGGGDSMCYFISNSDVGKRILAHQEIEWMNLMGNVA